MATSCHMGSASLSVAMLGTPPTLPLTPTSSCQPSEGLCYYSISRAEGQLAAKFGCWPSQTEESLAWLGQPACRQEVGRIICLCSESLCNLMIPSWREPEPEGTEVQGSVIILLVAVLALVFCLCSILGITRCCHRRLSVSPDNDLEVGGRRSSHRCLLPHWVSPLDPTPQPTPPLIRAASAPASFPERGTTNLSSFLEGTIPSFILGDKGQAIINNHMWPRRGHCIAQTSSNNHNHVLPIADKKRQTTSTLKIFVIHTLVLYIQIQNCQQSSQPKFCKNISWIVHSEFIKSPPTDRL